jgi:hypothetical protein
MSVDTYDHTRVSVWVLSSTVYSAAICFPDVRGVVRGDEQVAGVEPVRIVLVVEHRFGRIEVVRVAGGHAAHLADDVAVARSISNTVPDSNADARTVLCDSLQLHVLSQHM